MAMCRSLCLMLMIFSISHNADARQFRKLAPIPVSPDVATLKNQDRLVTNLEPIEARFVQEKIEEIVASWNTQGLQHYLDTLFPNRWQLISVLNRDIPKDAVLQLLTVQNINTINQQWVTNTPEKRVRESTVVATVNLQIRFLDATRGVITLPHTSQFYLRVVDAD